METSSTASSTLETAHSMPLPATDCLGEMCLLAGSALPSIAKVSSGNSKIYVHQLLFDESTDFIKVIKGDDMVAIEEHFNALKRLTPSLTPMSATSWIYNHLMDYKLPFVISDYELLQFFERQTMAPRLFYAPTWNVMVQPMHEVIQKVRVLGLLAQNGEKIPNLKIYEDLVRESAMLRGYNFICAKECLENRLGELTSFASTVNTVNIQYFMGRLKISTTVDLLHQIFSNPCWAGKFSAVIQLLEIHDILWKPSSPHVLQDLGSAIMAFINYVMSSCDELAMKLKEKFGWACEEVAHAQANSTSSTETQTTSDGSDGSCDSPPPTDCSVRVGAASLPKEEETLVDALSQSESGKSFMEWMRKSTIDLLEFLREYKVVGALISLALTVFTAAGHTFDALTHNYAKDGFFKAMKIATDGFGSAMRAKDFVSNALISAANTLMELFKIPTNKYAADFVELMYKTLDKAQSLSNELRSHPENFCAFSQKYFQLAAMIESIDARYRDLLRTDPGANKSYMAPVWTRMKDIHNQLVENFNEYRNTQQARQEPAVVWLWGEGGIGKSHMIAYIVQKLAQKTGLSNSSFVFPVMSEYCTGYKSQTVSIQEDFGVQNEARASSSAMDHNLTFMSVVSCNPFNLNMADIESKKTFYNSVFHVVASNFPTAPVQAVNDMYAFERRRDLLVHCVNEKHEKHLMDLDACDCWDDKDETDFSHIKFYKQNQIVTNKKELESERARRRNRIVDPSEFPLHAYGCNGLRLPAKQAEQSKKSWEKTGDSLNIDQIVEILYQRYLKKKEIHARRCSYMSAMSQAGEAVEVRANKWSEFPNVLLLGVPGIGKTTALQQFSDVLKSHKGVKYLSIVTRDDFEAFVRGGLADADLQYVLFHDLSAVSDSVYFDAFQKRWCERYDSQNEKTTIWIAAVNDDLLLYGFEKIDEPSSMENYEKFIRRSELFEFTFNNKHELPFLSVRVPFTGVFTRVDVANIGKENAPTYDEVVRIVKTSSDERYSLHELLRFMEKLRPTIVDLVSIFDLPYLENAVTEVSFVSDIPSDEMIEQLTTKTIFSLQKYVCTHAKYVQHKNAPSMAVFCKKMMSLVRDATRLDGMQFSGFKDLLVVGQNNHLLEHFRGMDMTLQFPDASFAILTRDGEVKAYQLIKPSDCLGVADSLDALVEDFSKIKIEDVVSGSLPPWVLLVMGCFDIVAKVALTTLVSVQKCDQNSKTWRAIAAHHHATKWAGEFVNISAENAAVTVEGLQYEEQIGANPGVTKMPMRGPLKLKVPPKKQTDTVVELERRKIEIKEPAPTEVKPARKQIKVVHDDSIGLYQVDLDITHIGSYTREMESVIEAIDPQSRFDASISSVIDVTCGNIVQMMSGDNRACNGLMLKGRYGVTVYHYFRGSEKHHVELFTGERYPIRLVKFSEKEDWAVFVIEDVKCMSFRDITCHIATRRMQALRTSPGVILSVTKKHFAKPSLYLRPIIMSDFGEVQVETEMKLLQRYTGLHLTESPVMPSTPVMTFAGDCGSPVLVCDTTLSRRIVAIHAAATSVCGLGSRLAIEDLIEVAVPQTLNLKGLFDEWEEPGFGYNIGGLPVVAVAASHQYVPEKSQIWKAPCPKGPKLYEPAVLSSLDTRLPRREDILEREILRWCKPRSVLNEVKLEHLDRAANGLADYYAQVMYQHNKEITVLTKKEALNGVTTLNHSVALNLKSSPGYPWSLLSVIGGKKGFIEMDEDGLRHFSRDELGKKTVEAQALISSWDQLINDARVGETQQLRAFKVFFKDELLKLHKINTPRTIAGCPLDLVCALRQYTHSYYAALADLWHILPPKVGVNAPSIDWHVLYKHLAQMSEKAVCLDFKGWDFNIHPEIQKRQMLFVNRGYELCDPFYQAEDTIIRNNLHDQHCVFPYLMKKRSVIQATGGQPSGDPNTANKNSTANDTLLCTIFMLIMHDHGFGQYATVEAYNANVARAFYGDDLLITISDLVIDWFNGTSIAFYAKQFGMEATDPDKSQEVKPWKPLIDCEFMSRGFREQNGFMSGPLKKSSIEKCTHYTTHHISHKFWEEQNKVRWDPDVLRSSAESTLIEAFIHGRPYYEELKRHWLETFKQCGVVGLLCTYEDQWQRYYAFPQMKLSEDMGEHALVIVDIPKFDRPRVPPYATKRRSRYTWNVGVTYQYRGGPPMTFEDPFADNVMYWLNINYGGNYNQATVNVYPPHGIIPVHRDDEESMDFSTPVVSLTVVGDGVFHLEHEGKMIHISCYPGLMIFMQNNDPPLHSRNQHSTWTWTYTFRKINGIDYIPKYNPKYPVPILIGSTDDYEESLENYH